MLCILFICSQSIYYPTSAFRHTTNVTYVNSCMFQHWDAILQVGFYTFAVITPWAWHLGVETCSSLCDASYILSFMMHNLERDTCRLYTCMNHYLFAWAKQSVIDSECTLLVPYKLLLYEKERDVTAGTTSVQKRRISISCFEMKVA